MRNSESKQFDQYSKLISLIGGLLQHARKNVYQQINVIFVQTCREVGKHIVTGFSEIKSKPLCSFDENKEWCAIPNIFPYFYIIY